MRATHSSTSALTSTAAAGPRMRVGAPASWNTRMRLTCLVRCSPAHARPARWTAPGCDPPSARVTTAFPAGTPNVDFRSSPELIQAKTQRPAAPKCNRGPSMRCLPESACPSPPRGPGASACPRAGVWGRQAPTKDPRAEGPGDLPSATPHCRYGTAGNNVQNRVCSAALHRRRPHFLAAQRGISFWWPWRVWGTRSLHQGAGGCASPDTTQVAKWRTPSKPAHARPVRWNCAGL